MAYKSTYLANKVLDAIYNATAIGIAADVWVSLHTASPGDNGANEVTGGSYARQQVPFGAAATKALANTGNVDYTSMPAATVTHVGVWDAVTAGNFLGGGILVAQKVVGAGDTFRFPTGDLDITEG